MPASKPASPSAPAVGLASYQTSLGAMNCPPFFHIQEAVANVPSHEGVVETLSANSVVPKATAASLSSSVAISEIIQALTNGTLVDITSSLSVEDPNADPIENEGAGIVYRGLCNGSLVAIKCFRFYLASNASNRNLLKCVQVAAGIAFLHGKNAVHGDLRGNHVLVSGDGTVNLTGFGAPILKALTAKFSNRDNSALSIRWAAPEILLGTLEASRPADVYALGMTILEILTGQAPFAAKPTQQVVIEVTTRQVTPDRPNEHFPDHPLYNRLWALLLQCWNKDPSARPLANEVHNMLRVMRDEMRLAK